MTGVILYPSEGFPWDKVIYYAIAYILLIGSLLTTYVFWQQYKKLKRMVKQNDPNVSKLTLSANDFSTEVKIKSFSKYFLDDKP